MFGMGMGLPPPEVEGLQRLAPTAVRSPSARERPRIVFVVLLAVVSVFFAVIGPKILANAINLIFEGAISKQPARRA